MAKIVVLDGHTLNPGDLDWSPLAQLGDLEVHPRTTPKELVSRSHEAAVLVTNKVALGADEFAALAGSLQFVTVTATGFNIVDIEAARQHGVTVSNVPGYSTMSVAQHTFALLHEVTARIGAHATAVRDGGWAACADFSFTLNPWHEWAGKRFGIVGYGAIGQAVSRLAEAYGFEVVVHTRTPRDGVQTVDKETLARTCDVISLHCPLTPETRLLVNDEFLRLMKPTAILLNTARGPLIDELALATALQDGRLAGAGLDVLTQEPPSPTNPLTHQPNAVITPHLAWASVEARQRLMVETVANVRAFLTGSPRNVVS